MTSVSIPSAVTSIPDRTLTQRSLALYAHITCTGRTYHTYYLLGAILLLNTYLPSTFSMIIASLIGL